MRTWQSFNSNEISRELGSDRYRSTTQAFIDYNSPMESGYENIRLTLRKIRTGYPNEGKEEAETVTIKLSDDEIEGLLKFVNDFKAEYHKRFIVAQVDDPEPRRPWKR